MEKCTEGLDECPRKLNWIKMKLKEVIFSCLIMVILFELILYKILSRLHLIHIIFSFIFFYLYSHGLDFEDHGFFNFKAFFIFFIIFFIIFLQINLLIFLKQKKENKIKNFILMLNKNY